MFFTSILKYAGWLGTFLTEPYSGLNGKQAVETNVQFPLNGLMSQLFGKELSNSRARLIWVVVFL
jgi:hypothetical protein